MTRAAYAAALGLLAAIVALHLRGIDGAFLSDDFSHLNVIWSAAQRGELMSWTLERFYQPLGNATFAYRPIAFASYVGDWLLYGPHATGWHATNLLLHLANSAGVGVLVSRWLAIEQRRHLYAALLGACAMATYPFAGEVTFWPVGRFDLLASGFSILCLLCLPLGTSEPTGRRRLLGAVSLLCALLSKESTIPLPVVATILLFCGAPPGRDSPPAAWGRRLGVALQEAWLLWLVLALYLAARYAMFGSAWKVYPHSSLPSGLVELGERLSSARHIAQANLGAQYLELILVLGVMVLVIVAIWSSLSLRLQRRSFRLGLGLLGCCAVYAVAPASGFPLSGSSGEGARNLYTAWMYLALFIGVASAARAWLMVPGLVLVTAAAIGQAESLAQWHSAARQMNAITRSVPALAAEIGSDRYALILLPDHHGPALFARNAQGGIVLPPTQDRDYSSRVVAMTSPNFEAWSEQLRSGSIARLKGQASFDKRNFLGLYCWRPATMSFVHLDVTGDVLDASAWRQSAEQQYGATGCLTSF